MKSTFKFFAVLTLALAFASPHAAAQTAKRRLVLTTQFSFAVETRELPAGTYWITLNDGWLQMQTADGRAVMSALTLPVSGKSNEGTARAVFHRYHLRYFLSEVWLADSDRGRQTLESHDERVSRRVEAPQAVVVQLRTQGAGESR
jgi:hypothetical protein